MATYAIITRHYENMRLTFGKNYLIEIQKAFDSKGTTQIQIIMENLFNTYGFEFCLRFHNTIIRKAA